MIRIVHKSTGFIVAKVTTLQEAYSVEAVDPENTKIHPDDILAYHKEEARSLVLSQAEHYGQLLTTGYPQSERDSWTVKATEARDIVNGATPSMENHPVIMTESLFTGTLPLVIATIILHKATLFGKAAGAISGIRQAAIATIDAATGIDEINAALLTAKHSAEEAFKGLGK